MQLRSPLCRLPRIFLSVLSLAAGCGAFVCVLTALADQPLTPGQCPSSPPASYSSWLTAEETGWYRNPDGSCVQCSNGMCGVQNNLPAWSSLLWDSPYGRAERGGSGPDRVAGYAKQRGMRIYNVTGAPTIPFMEWAAKTGRFCAMGAGGNHFQYFYGRDWDRQRYLVCNNNSTGKVDVYDLAGFTRLHLASGRWIVVPDEPACPPPPSIAPWWR